MIKKLIYKKIWAEIKKAKNILLTLHPSPDGDSIGSNLALYHVLNKMGKKVTLLGGDSEFPERFLSMPGSDKIVSQNFFKINPEDYDLFIVADISNEKQISKQGNIIIPKTLKTIVIDHHASNLKFANINLIDENAPATCQLVYDFLEAEKIKITKSIAVCLFIGLYTDTGGFKYFNTNYKTFLAAANLSKIYPDFNKIIFEIENNDQPDRLKFLSLMLGSITTHISGKVAISSVDYKTIEKNKISNNVANGSDVANYVKSVVGWEIGVSMIEAQPNLIKISFRTRDSNKYDLTKISVALGGGGHKVAAGVTLNDISLPKAKDLVLTKICQVYPKIDKI